ERLARAPDPPFRGPFGDAELAGDLGECLAVEVEGLYEPDLARTKLLEGEVQRRGGVARRCLRHVVVGQMRYVEARLRLLRAEIGREEIARHLGKPRHRLTRQAVAPPVAQRAQPRLLHDVLGELPVPARPPRDVGVERTDVRPVLADELRLRDQGILRRQAASYYH